MIKSIREKPRRKLEIDLTMQDGNAYVLLAYAKRLSQELNKNWKTIHDQMTSGDYENLLKVFDKEFEEFVILWR